MTRLFNRSVLSSKLGESIYIYFGLFIYIPYNTKISKYYDVSFLCGNCGNCGNRALFLLKYEKNAVTTNILKSYHSYHLEQKNLTINIKKTKTCHFLLKREWGEKLSSHNVPAPPWSKKFKKFQKNYNKNLKKG